MKKSIFLIVAIVFSNFLNAQIFVGGSAGVKISDGKVINYTEPKTTFNGNSLANFSLSPFIGYSINENFAIGLQLSVAYSKNNFEDDPNVLSRRSTALGISPFARYYFFKWNKFSAYTQANLSVYNYWNEETRINNLTIDNPTSLSIGLGVFPSIQYDLNDRIGLFTNLNFLYLGYNFTISKHDIENGNKIISYGHNFDFLADTNNLINTESIQVGFFVNL